MPLGAVAKLLVSHMVISCHLQVRCERQLLCSYLCGQLTALQAAQGAGTMRQLESLAWQLRGINEHFMHLLIINSLLSSLEPFVRVGYHARLLGYVLRTCTPFLNFPKILRFAVLR